jgi:hypothetical protein
MSQKTAAQLISDANLYLPDNTTEEISAADQRDRVIDLADSNLNKIDGGTITTFISYLTNLTFTDDKHLVAKKYVDDLIIALNALHQGTNNLTEPLIFLDDKIGFGGTPSGQAHFILQNDASPLSKTTWTDVDVVFGEEGDTGKALGVSYTTGTSTINMNFLEPSVQWLNAQFNFGTIGFYSGGGTLGLYQNALGKVCINTDTAAAGALLTIRGIDDSTDDYQLRTFNDSGDEVFSLRNDKAILCNGNYVYLFGDGTSIGDIRQYAESGAYYVEKFNGTTWDILISA